MVALLSLGHHAQSMWRCVMTNASRCFSMRVCTVLFPVLVWAFSVPVSAGPGTGAPPAGAAAASRPGATTDAPTGVVEFRIRDSNTGYGIAATLTLYPTEEGPG